MDQFWKDLFSQVTTPIVVIGAVTYLLRKFLDAKVEAKLDQFRIGVQAEANRQLFEFQTTFGSLHHKRSDVIAELYKQLQITFENLKDLTRVLQMAGGPSVPKKKQVTFDSYATLAAYFAQHRIYFSKELCSKMDNMLSLTKSAFVEFDTAHVYGMQNSDRYQRDETGLWRQSWETVNKEIPPVLDAIEQEFRSILSSK